MSASPRVLKASLIKEMRVWKRNGRKLALAIMLPILLYVSFTMLMGGVYYGAGIDTALVVEEQDPGLYTNGLIEILGQHDPIPPSFNLIRMDSETASILLENGDVLLIIIIPIDFEYALANNETTYIHIHVNNMHEDMTKNLRMPVIRKLDIFYQTYLSDDAKVSFEVELLYPYTPPRLAYMAWTVTIYGIVFSSMFIAGSSMTQEFEQETIEELTLSNQSPHAILLGKMLSAVIPSHLSTPLLLVLAWALFGVWPNGNIAIFILVSVLISLCCSGIGIVLGAISRSSVYMVPLSAMIALFYWLTGGGLTSLSVIGVSFGVVDGYLPFSNVYRSMIAMFIQGTYNTLLVDVAVIGLFAALSVIAAPPIASRLSGMNYGANLEQMRMRLARARKIRKSMADTSRA